MRRDASSSYCDAVTPGMRSSLRGVGLLVLVLSSPFAALSQLSDLLAGRNGLWPADMRTAIVTSMNAAASVKVEQLTDTLVLTLPTIAPDPIFSVVCLNFGRRHFHA